MRASVLASEKAAAPRASRLLLGAAAVLVALASPHAAGERSGREVVESTCAACHAAGKDGAPKIGDRKAWRKRAEQGLQSLTQNALKGIRAMPAHGGNPGLADLEVARGVVYMVNRSGGRWIEPASLGELTAERSGPQVVREHCASCHESGARGAPRIGDLAAWTPFLERGVDHAVRNAIRGHGGMPPRGDRADLTDAELRHAVLAMISPAAAPGAATRADATTPSVLFQSIGGVNVHLGIVSAQTLRALPENAPERSMHGGPPRGRGYYHLNVTLIDAETKAPIDGAKVQVRLELPGASSVSSSLQPMQLGAAPAYGNYVRMRADSAYRIVLQVERPGDAGRVEARFAHRTGR